MKMRSKAIYVWAGIQIVIGLLLFAWTAYMAASFLPAIRNAVRQTGENLAEAATALGCCNAFYCASATNLFALGESMEDVAQNFDVIGRDVMNAGTRIHFDVPVLNKVNDVGNSVHAIGEVIINVAAALRKERDVIEDYRNVVHPQNSNTLNDTAETLTDMSELAQDGSSMDGILLYFCLLGGLLSLLFVINGIFLVSMPSFHGHYAVVSDREVTRGRQQGGIGATTSHPSPIRAD